MDPQQDTKSPAVACLHRAPTQLSVKQAFHELIHEVNLLCKENNKQCILHEPRTPSELLMCAGARLASCIN